MTSPEPSGEVWADRRSVEFELASSRSAPFAEAAMRDGLAVSPEEVARRVVAYRKLYPGKDVDPAKVERILLAENYLATKGMGTGDDELESAVAARWDSSRFASAQEAEQAKRSVRTQLLLDRREVSREASKLMDLAQIDLLFRHKPRAQWEPRQLQIPGDPEECLTWSGSACFLTLREYNAASTQFQLPAETDLDSARSTILRKYLLDKRRAELARELGLDQNPDSILDQASMAREAQKWLLSSRRFGKPIYEEPLLQAAYSKYYRRYFAARQKVVLAVVGATDSAYIDSIHGVYSAWERAAGSGHGTGKAKTREPGLPWAYFHADELPMELEAPADSLRIGQTSKPFRTPYGFFIVRLAKVARTGEKPFSRARPQLMFLAARDKFLAMDSVIEAKARRYYAENRIRYAVPDTIGLLAWLIPGPAKPIATKPGGKAESTVQSDTADFRAVATALSMLPAEIRMQLQVAVRKDSLRAFFGPLPDKCGRWYFKVLSRKPAHGLLPYHLARKDILERISAPMADEDAGLATEDDINAVLLNIGLSEVYLQDEIRKSAAMDPPHPESQTEVERAKSLASEIARMQEQQAQYRREEQRLLEGTRVNQSLLRR